MCVCQVVNEIGEMDDLPLHGSQYDMAEFAKKYFREAQRNKRSDTQTHTYTPTGPKLKLTFILMNALTQVHSCRLLLVFFPTVIRKPKRGRRAETLLTWSNSPR